MFNLFLFNVFCCWGVSRFLSWTALSFLSSGGLLLFLLRGRLFLNFLGCGGRLVVYSRGRHRLGLCLTIIFRSVFDSRVGGNSLIIVTDWFVLKHLTLLVLFLSLSLRFSMSLVLSCFFRLRPSTLEFL